MILPRKSSNIFFLLLLNLLCHVGLSKGKDKAGGTGPDATLGHERENQSLLFANSMGQDSRYLQANNDTERLPLIEIVAQVFVLKRTEMFLTFGQVAANMTASADDGNEGGQQWTVCMPWNRAWDVELDAALRTKLQRADRAWRVHLQDLLFYHISDTILPFDSVADESFPAEQEITMKNGEPIILTKQAGTTSRLRINGILVLATYQATNGQAYMLDEVLLPAWVDRTLGNVVSSTFTTFSSMIVSAGLESVLNDPDATLTLFAPTNEAFEALSADTRAQLNLDSAYMLDVLQYHIAIDGPLPSMNIQQAKALTTVQGKGFLIGKSEAVASIVIQGETNSAKIVMTDIPANNGLAHGIDTVLLTNPASGQSISDFIHSVSFANSSVWQDFESPEARALLWLVTNQENFSLDTVLPEDRQRLVQLYPLLILWYSSTKGWIDESGWLTATDECTWIGISCDENGVVVEINLNRNGLTGTIPVDLALLESLRILDLANNDIFGEIPATIFSALLKLEEVYLENNMLAGELSNLSGLTNIKIFHVSSNALKGDISMFWALTTLEVLVLDSNAFSGELDGVSALQNLST